jgi:methyl-accepting chemotaxis protein
MGRISGSSVRISDITQVIDGIAFQTNILALNAAVEAARAGDQGRSFAVVASEVRTLAHRCAAAAREIKALIAESAGHVESGTKLVDHAGGAMTDIVASIERFNGLIGRIHDAADGQSRGIVDINDRVASLDNATKGNAALVEQSAAAAESLRAQAQRLTSAVSAFKVA